MAFISKTDSPQPKRQQKSKSPRSIMIGPAETSSGVMKTASKHAKTTVEPIDILGPLGLMQYEQCFMINLVRSEKRGSDCINSIPIERLRKVEMDHLTQMNISSFHDQKRIMTRIRKFISFRDETLEKSHKAHQILSDDGGDLISSTKQPLSDISRGDLQQQASENIIFKRNECKNFHDKAQTKKLRKSRRRSSIDMGQISLIRAKTAGRGREGGPMAFDRSKPLEDLRRPQTQSNKTTNNNFSRSKKDADIPDLIKEVKENIRRDIQAERRISVRVQRSTTNSDPSRRRMSFTQSLDEFKAAKDLKEQAMLYGDRAQRKCLANNRLDKVGKRAMNEFINAVACERYTLLFLDSDKKEIFFFDKHSICIRFPSDTGIAGYVAETEEIVNVADAYNDERFNPEIDKRTGFRTKSILCAPIRSPDGDEIFAVVQMLNKTNGDFDEADEKVIQACCCRTAEALAMQKDSYTRAELALMENRSCSSRRKSV